MKLIVILILLGVGSLASGDDADETQRKEPSKRLLVFLSMSSGFFTNIEEFDQEKAEGELKHDVINETLRSVFVPALPNEMVLYMEEAVNGVLFRLQLLIVREKEMGIISIEPHNFTDISKYKIGQFDATKDLANVRLEDLSPTRKECESVYMQTDVNVFVGTFQDCNRIVDGEPAKYAITLSCKSVALLVYWRRMKEKDSPLPYVNRNLFRYPLHPSVAPGADDFLPPCDCK